MACEISTPCYYLFGKETGEIFPLNKNSQEFINKSLKTLMQINLFLISRKEALFLIHPTAFNNQCHLYALMVAQKNRDERFLHLALFLSHAFLTDTSLLGKIADKVASETKIEYPVPKKAFSTFLKDPEGERTRAARSALNLFFEHHLKNRLNSEDSLLYKELSLLACRELQLPPTNGAGLLYTYPKLAGVAFLLDSVGREKIPLLFKVKVMTMGGLGSFTHCSTSFTNQEGAVIVFEMIATDDSLTFLECRDLAKKCPSHSKRNPSKKNRHAEGTSCLFCTEKRIVVDPYKERILPVLQRADQMLFALGVDFILESQRPYLPFFSDENSFPMLTRLFQEALPNIENYGLSMKTPLNMSVAQVYADCALNAIQETFVMDASYEHHLKSRKLI